MNLMVLLVGGTALIYVILLVIILAKWKSGKTYFRYTLFLIAGTLWVTVGVFEVSSLRNIVPISDLFSKINFTLAALISYFVVLFAIHFPLEDLKFNIRKELLFIIPIIGVMVPIWLGKIFYYVGDKMIYSTRWYLIYFFVILIYLAIIAPVVFIKKIIRYHGISKIQIKYILFGYLIAIIVGLLFSALYAFIPELSRSNFYGIANICTLFFALSCFYVLFRYRFMDIKVVMRKSLIYGISLILTLAIYTYLALILKKTIEKSWNVSTVWTAVILIALVSLGFPLVKKLVERLVDSIFKGRKSIDLAVKEIREKMASKTDLESLAELISQEIGKFLEVKEVKIFTIDHRDKKLIYKDGDGNNDTLDPNNELLRYFEKYPTVLVRDEIGHLLEEREGKFEKEILQKAEKEMKKKIFSLVLPFKNEEEIFALVALGDREEGRAYTVQDVNYLESLREQVGLTLANAILYQETMEHLRLKTQEGG